MVDIWVDLGLHNIVPIAARVMTMFQSVGAAFIADTVAMALLTHTTTTPGSVTTSPFSMVATSQLDPQSSVPSVAYHTVLSVAYRTVLSVAYHMVLSLAFHINEHRRHTECNQLLPDADPIPYSVALSVEDLWLVGNVGTLATGHRNTPTACATHLSGKLNGMRIRLRLRPVLGRPVRCLTWTPSRNTTRAIQRAAYSPGNLGIVDMGRENHSATSPVCSAD
jgi:hypothetical protein